MENKDIRPLIIGYGLAGGRHLQAQLDLGVETGVYTKNPEKTKALKERGVTTFDNLEDAIDWSNLVHVCTPDDKHAEFAAMALKKGKTVFCEKAFTTNLQDAIMLQELAHQNNSTLIVAQNYRLTPTFLETRRLIQEDSIGEITGIEATYLHDMTNYRLGTKERNTQDFLYVGGSHAVDLACWIIGQQVVSVQANVGTKIRNEYTCQERYQIILKFASGILGHINLDASSPRPIDGSDLIVNGEKGQLVSHNKKDELLIYREGDNKVRYIKFANTSTFTTPLEVKIMDNLLTGKSTSHWPLPGIDEAVNIIRILDAIEKAASSGKNEPINY